MRRWPDDAPRAETAASLLTRGQLGFASALLVVAAALAYHWSAGGGDDTRTSAAPSATGAGGTQGAVESGTSLSLANPFSTFQQAAPADPAPATSPVPASVLPVVATAPAAPQTHAADAREEN